MKLVRLQMLMLKVRLYRRIAEELKRRKRLDQRRDSVCDTKVLSIVSVHLQGQGLHRVHGAFREELFRGYSGTQVVIPVLT